MAASRAMWAPDGTIDGARGGRAQPVPANIAKDLGTCLDRLRADGSQWRALVVHLSRLRPETRKSDRLRGVGRAVESLVASRESRAFRMPDNDIVLLAREDSLDALERIATRLRYLFRDDPLSRTGDDEKAGFCSWFDLGRDFDVLAAFAARAADDGQARKRAAGERVRAAKEAMSSDGVLTPAQLAALERGLAGQDISGAIRAQPVCGLRPDLPPHPVFDERYVSIPALEKTLRPQAPLMSDPWLFQRLTASLDRRMIQHTGDQPVPERAISLNLTAATVRSADFDRLEALLLPRLAGKLVIELQAADFFMNPAGFAAARDVLKRRGHTVCLDGATGHTVAFMDLRDLGVDLVKLRWTEALRHRPGSRDAAAMAESVARIGPDRLILCRCDGPEAIDAGQAMGIALFQGRHVDRLIAVRDSVSRQAEKVRRALADRPASPDGSGRSGAPRPAGLRTPRRRAGQPRRGSVRLASISQVRG